MCKKKMRWVFVYGTLKVGGRLHLKTEAISKVDSINGDMFSVGAFPAVRLGGENKIHGEVHLVDTPTWNRMLQIEGRMYDAKDIITDNGIPAKVFEWNEFAYKIERLQPVPSGVWECRR